MSSDPDDFYPELHDAGKLINSALGIVQAVDATGALIPWKRGHSFEDVAWAHHGLEPPRTASWLGVRDHHADEFKDEKLPFIDLLDRMVARDRLMPALPPADDLVRFRRRVLLKLADHTAAAQSRVLLRTAGIPAGGEGPGNCIKLWNRASATSTRGAWSPVANEADWGEFVRFISEPATTGAQFIQRYARHMRMRAEDKQPVRSLTSLYSHTRLVGQIYRILDRAVTVQYDAAARQLQLRYGSWSASSLDEIHDTWMFRLVRAKVWILQAPVDATDLAVFEALNVARRKLREHPVLADHLLFETVDTLWLLLYADDSVAGVSLADVLQYQLETSAVEISTTLAPLNDVTPDISGLIQHLDDVKADKDTDRATAERIQKALDALSHASVTQRILYPDGIAEPENAALDPPLCEVCQLRRSPDDSQHRIPTSHGGIEYLCPACRRLRDGPHSGHLSRLAQWQQAGTRTRGQLAWIRMTVQPKILAKQITARFTDFLAEIWANLKHARRPYALARACLRPTAMYADFLDDYVDFLGDLEKWVKETYVSADWETPGAPEWQEISREVSANGAQATSFFVLRLFRGAQIMQFVGEYYRRLKQYFPDMLDPCPSHLSINLAPGKYPFFEHWRDLERAQGEIWIHRPGTAVCSLSLRCLPAFLPQPHEHRPGSGAAYLHKLAAIERRSGGSRVLAEATFLDDMAGGDLPPDLLPFKEMLQRRPVEVTFGQLLNWHKLTTWERA